MTEKNEKTLGMVAFEGLEESQTQTHPQSFYIFLARNENAESSQVILKLEAENLRISLYLLSAIRQ